MSAEPDSGCGNDSGWRFVAGATDWRVGTGRAAERGELQALVAPIALYPDALVAQILGARDFSGPDSSREQLASQNQNLTGSSI